MKLWEWILNAIFAVTKKPSISITKTIGGTLYVNPNWQNFADKIRPFALNVEAKTGIPWRFAMIQAGHESRHGESRLTVDANNLFGLTGDSWYTQGKPVYWIQTRESAKDGTQFETKRPFRKYASWQESLDDWASLIQRRYPKAFEAAKLGDFEGFAKGLESGGYATDRDPKTKELVYAKKLIELNNSLEGLA